MDDHIGVRSRSNVFQLETEEVLTSQEQTTEANRVLMSFTPIMNSMRVFGLYFTCTAQENCKTVTEQSQQLVRRFHCWSLSRVHATFMLLLMWLNTVRIAFIFDGQETLGAHLFVKLGILSNGVLTIMFQTAYYAASHTGSLDRVLQQLNLSIANPLPKYSCRSKVITAICWLYLAWNMFDYGFKVFVQGRHNDFIVMLLKRSLPEYYSSIISAVFVLMQLQIVGSLIFSQGMNYMVMTVLYNQFDKLSDEFSKCIGDQGQFTGNFDQFRRRHQAISHSVQEADRFLMITIGANLCAQIVTIIVVFYSLIFFREDTITFHPVSAILYVAWLSGSIFSLALSAGQAIYLNHTESIFVFIL